MAEVFTLEQMVAEVIRANGLPGTLAERMSVREELRQAASYRRVLHIAEQNGFSKEAWGDMVTTFTYLPTVAAHRRRVERRR